MPRFAYPAVFAGVLAVLTALASPAAAKPGYVDFTPTNTSHRYDGLHGIFTGDAVYGPENKLFWSLRLSESVREIVLGDMSCGASVEGQPNYHDHHASIPSNYQWHSVVPKLEVDKQYRLVANCAFTAQNGHTTAPGRVDYSVVFTLHSK